MNITVQDNNKTLWSDNESDNNNLNKDVTSASLYNSSQTVCESCVISKLSQARSVFTRALTGMIALEETHHVSDSAGLREHWH